jgi:hypothetical protein
VKLDPHAIIEAIIAAQALQAESLARGRVRFDGAMLQADLTGLCQNSSSDERNLNQVIIVVAKPAGDVDRAMELRDGIRHERVGIDLHRVNL